MVENTMKRISMLNLVSLDFSGRGRDIPIR